MGFCIRQDPFWFADQMNDKRRYQHHLIMMISMAEIIASKHYRIHKMSHKRNKHTIIVLICTMSPI